MKATRCQISMNKEFVNYNTALALKELGFDEPCLAMYDNVGKIYSRGSFGNLWRNNDQGLLTAPLYQQAFRWFREKHGLGHMINGIEYETFIMNIGGVTHVFNPFEFNSYEEAEQACLDKLIEIVKNSNTEHV